MKRSAWLRMICTIAAMTVVGLVLEACGGLEMPAPHAPFSPPGRGRAGALEVGAARADITPPPGASLFGHGPGARVAVGYWTRLYCRAFYLSTQGALEPGIALVSCDLPMISTLLQRRTAARIFPVLPTSHLVLSAVHTHAGPGHYFDAENLSGATSSHFPGYDDAMVDFLSERIAEAVSQARADRRPAQMRWVRSSAWGLTRNRSLPAHRLNPSSYPHSSAPPRRLTAGQRAIDPTLRLLEFVAIDRARGTTLGTIGSITFFAMHPTVLPNTNRYYGADVFGVATRLVENELRQQWASLSDDTGARCWRGELRGDACVGVRRPEPLHAIINTNFGDMTPQRSLGRSSEAVRLGERLARHIWAAHCADGACGQAPVAGPIAGDWKNLVTLDLRYLEANLPRAPLLPAAAGVRESRLCEEPALGLQAIRGAADHPSILEWLLPARQATADYDSGGCQSPKALVFFLTGGFPKQIPLSLVRIDDSLISFVPAELTIAAGEQINAAVRQGAAGLDIDDPDTLVSGIANGYIQYVTTQEEYQLQRYEGASTIYGPSSATYLAQTFEHLARHMAGESVDRELQQLMNDPQGRRRVGEAEAFEYSPGPKRKRYWRAEWDTPLAELEAARTDPNNAELCSIPGTKPPAVCMQWFDGGPGQVALTRTPWIELVAVEGDAFEVVKVVSARLGPRALSPWRRWKIEPIDDRSYHFFTRVLRPAGEGYRWSTVLRPNRRAFRGLPPDTNLRIRARGPAGNAPVLSPAFRLDRLPHPCTPEELRGACAYP